MESEEKIEYFCITSSNEFKIMDDMHHALVLDNFQKTLHASEESTYANVFDTFFNKIITMKPNLDLYSQNLSLLEKFLSVKNIKEIKDISEQMNFMLNYNFNNEFCLTKKIAENIGTILFYGFGKLKSKFKTYMIKSYADFKEKIENIKFHQIDIINEYYNQELFDKKNKGKNLPKYIYRKEAYVTNEGKVCCKESKLLPNELILLVNKLQYIKTLTFKTDDIYNDKANNQNNNLEIILYLMILINVQWLLPNILIVNYDLTSNILSNALIDIMSIKLSQQLQGINIFEKKVFYSNQQIPYSDTYNYEMMIKYKNKDITNNNQYKKEENIIQLYNEIRKSKKDITNKQSQKNSNNRKADTTKEMLSFGESDNDSSDGEYQDYLLEENANMFNNENENTHEDEERKINKQIIKELYNNYINKHTKELDMIIITASFIRIWDKLHALNIKCPDIFNSEIKESFYSKNIKQYSDLNFLNMLTDIKKLNILNVEFNSLDYMNFSKILGMISSNFNLSALRLIFFGNDKLYSPGGIYKLLNDLNESSLIQLNKNIIKKRTSQSIKNTDFEELILNYHLLEHFQKNLEILCSKVRNHRKSLSEFVVVLNIPTALINNDRYNLSLIKFIINLLIFLAFDKHEVKIFKIISPLLKLDTRKNPLLNDLFNKITETQHQKNLLSVHTLYLQLDLCNMNTLVNLITKNLNTLNIGNLDVSTFLSIANKLTNEDFINDSKLINIKIVLKDHITKYDSSLKENVVKLYKYTPKYLATMELITKLNVNYEDLCEIMNEIKKNYVNKYVITFNEHSNAFVDKVIFNLLPSVIILDKKNEQKLKLLTKIIINKNVGNSDDQNKKIKARKKIFNNIKMMAFERKDINFDLNN